MEPIIQREPAKKTRAAQPMPGSAGGIGYALSGFTFILALLTSLGAFALSAYFLIGFAQTDTGVWTLLSSAALCFGVGALAYIPSGLIAAWARAARRGQGRKYHIWASLFCLLPWLALSIILIFFSALPVHYSAAALAISALLLLWPLKHITALGRK